jgi:hypothetical protein
MPKGLRGRMGSSGGRKPSSVISAKPVRGKPASPGKGSAPGQKVAAAAKARNVRRKAGRSMKTTGGLTSGAFTKRAR